ncbi:MAG TPA: hypothetical protein VGL40_12725 [Bacillota bacterium]|jgi:hypothetical protein
MTLVRTPDEDKVNARKQARPKFEFSLDLDRLNMEMASELGPDKGPRSRGKGVAGRTETEAKAWAAGGLEEESRRKQTLTREQAEDFARSEPRGRTKEQ